MGPNPIELAAGEAVCQIMFFLTNSPVPANNLNGTGEADLYQDQELPIPTITLYCIP